MTWPELKEQISAKKTIVIVPIGGTEQNGPYIALGKHNVRVKLLSEKIAKTLGNALVAPVIAYVPEGGIDPPTSHMRFPGTITVPDEIFEKTLESAARSFKLHGFRDIVFLGDHGGYQADLKIVADRLNREWARSSVRAHNLPEYYKTSQDVFVQILHKLGFSVEEVGTHAGLADTSLMMALDPRLVRLDQLRASSAPKVEQGIYGDPRRSNADLGQLGVNEIVSRSVAAIRKAEERN